MKKSNYSFVFNFESNFDEQKAIAWMENHWTNIFYYDIIYLVVIFGLKNFMKNRPPYKPKVPAIMWNVMIASFSILGTARTLPEFMHSLWNHGFHYSVCDRSFIASDEVSRFWVFLFVLSKIVELGDTLFVVFRKHPLIFLHWYHHIVVLFYSWYSYKEVISTSRWFCVMNFAVHSLMYSYYALRCCNFNMPKVIPVIVTSLQILQMFIGFFLNIYVFWQFYLGIHCGATVTNTVLSSIIYLSFFILFFRFFQKSYLSNSKKEKLITKSETSLLDGKKCK